MGILALFVPIASVFADSTIVINEFSPHPSDKTEWVELANPEGKDISDYWLDDDLNFSEDAGTSDKKQLSSISMTVSGIYTLLMFSSLFNNSGDSVVLFDASGTVIDQYEYTHDPGENRTIGRSPDRTGTFTILSSATQGSANSAAQPTITSTPTPTTKPTTTPKPPTPTRQSKVPTSAAMQDAEEEETETLPDTAEAESLILSKSKSKLTGIPTAILGVASSAAKKKLSPTPKKKNNKGEVKDFRKDTNMFPFAQFAMTAGGVLLLVCAILLYWKKSRKK